MTTTMLIPTALTACLLPALAAAGAPKPTIGHATIRGVDYYYEVHGKGEPLLLLHGGNLSIDSLAPSMPTFTKGRQVILVDLQGHGRTTLGNRPLRCEAIADDLNTLLGQLGRTQVDVLGFSFGGCVALRLAVQHPDRVRRLVLACTVFADDGWYPEMRVQQKQIGAAMAPMMAETPIYKTYKAVAPKPEDFPRLLDALGDYMRQTYDWSGDVAKLRMPVMLIYGDADMIRPEHQVKFYQLLGGGLKDAGWNRETISRNRLAILPDLTHYEAAGAPRVAEAALPFLDGRYRGGKSASQ
jgi:pimeloyl-ACP methyl ester carboxylesterase